MNKIQFRVIGLLLAVLAAFEMLIVVSHSKALQIENEILKPCLSSSMSYNRVVRFGIFDSWISMLPHWTVTYREIPTDKDYDTPAISVNLFGQVADWRSKDVGLMLVRKGYRDSY